MGAFEIRGGRSLNGTITPQGAKNEALQVLCAALLTAEPVTYTNVPDILDVNTLIELMGDMGVKIERPAPNTVVLQANDVNPDFFIDKNFKKIRQTTWRCNDRRAYACKIRQGTYSAARRR